MFFSFLVLSEKFFAGTFSKGTGYLNWAVRVFGEDLPHTWGRARPSIISVDRRVVKSRLIAVTDWVGQDLSRGTMAEVTALSPYRKALATHGALEALNGWLFYGLTPASVH